uniref:Scavenger receptor class B member 2 n=1 Tax=Papio anubis TaxID=9555 RepID=A0A8I5NFI9_PAPAN
MGRCCFYTAGTLSLLLLVTSVTLLVARVFQKAVDQSIEKKIVLRNGTEAFDSWEKPPLPVYTQFYFFNVTNPEEILRGETPRVEEVGPYTYRLNITWKLPKLIACILQRNGPSCACTPWLELECLGCGKQHREVVTLAWSLKPLSSPRSQGL